MPVSSLKFSIREFTGVCRPTGNRRLYNIKYSKISYVALHVLFKKLFKFFWTLLSEVLTCVTSPIRSTHKRTKEQQNEEKKEIMNKRTDERMSWRSEWMNELIPVWPTGAIFNFILPRNCGAYTWTCSSQIVVTRIKVSNLQFKLLVIVLSNIAARFK
jgi:hypothetical protein